MYSYIGCIITHVATLHTCIVCDARVYVVLLTMRYTTTTMTMMLTIIMCVHVCNTLSRISTLIQLLFDRRACIQWNCNGNQMQINWQFAISITHGYIANSGAESALVSLTTQLAATRDSIGPI